MQLRISKIIVLLNLALFVQGARAEAVADAEIKFEKKQLVLNGKKITVEVAKTNEEQMRGLMFRKELCEACGMLFVYDEETTKNFWMKNTFLPLSIGFFNKRKELVDIQEMSPVVSEMQKDIPVYTSKKQASYALEMNAHWFTRNKISLKSQFQFGK